MSSRICSTYVSDTFVSHLRFLPTTHDRVTYSIRQVAYFGAKSPVLYTADIAVSSIHVYGLHTRELGKICPTRIGIHTGDSTGEIIKVINPGMMT